MYVITVCDFSLVYFFLLDLVPFLWCVCVCVCVCV